MKLLLPLALVTIIIVHFLTLIPLAGPAVLIMFLLFVPFAAIFVFIIHKNSILVKALIITVAGIYLTLGTFYIYKNSSFDGFATYLKIMYLVKTDPYQIINLANPIRPFFVEAVLGFIWKYSSLNIVGLVISMTTVLVGYLAYYFYKISGKDAKTSILSISILLFSPLFINLGLREYKVEIFLAVFVLLSYIYFQIFISKCHVKHLLVFGVCSGIAVLIKFLFLPIALILSAFIIFEMVFHMKKGSLKTTVLSLILVFCIFGPLLMWIRLFGAQLSYLGFISKEFAYYKVPKTILTVDESVYKDCRNTTTLADYNQYLPNKSPLDKIIQPVNYFLNRTTDIPNLSTTFDPGILLYLSIIIYIPLGLFWFNKSTRPQKYFFLSSSFFIVLFYLEIGATFWYLIPVLPLVSPTLPVLFYNLTDNKYLRWFFEAVILTVMFIYVFINAYVAINAMHSRIFTNSAENSELSRFNYFGLAIDDYSNFLDSLAPEGYVYQHGETVLNTFSRNYEKLLPRTYYFAGNRELKSLYEELKQKNVRYINTNPFESVGRYVTGCALSEDVRFIKFSEEYLTPAYKVRERVVVWKLIDEVKAPIDSKRNLQTPLN